ncbi:MAG: carboxypeptidase-like regulatory domain-containing protein [Pirellulales bacterium]
MNKQLKNGKNMSNFWNITKYGFALIALPLVVTAAASAHQRIANATPISLEVTSVVSELSNIGVERCHTVALNRIGGVDGRVVSFVSNQSDRGLSDLVVRFVKNGKTIRQGKTNSDGVFSINNVPEGVYSFIASGKNSFAAYQISVISDSTSVYSKVIELAAVSRNNSLAKVFESTDLMVGGLVANELGDVVPDGANRVALMDGVLSGKILAAEKSLALGVSVNIVQDGNLVANVTADASGEYLIPDLTAGIYELVASGTDCVAVVGFQVVDAASTDGSVTFVSTAGPAAPSYASSLVTTVVPRQDIVQEESAEVEFDGDDGGDIVYSAESLTMGGAAGSAGVSSETFVVDSIVGGGGGGGGGLGRLVGIAGLTVGVVAVAGDGGATPVSPVNP